MSYNRRKNEIKENLKKNIYPIPSDGIVNINSLHSISNIQILNMEGQFMDSFSSSSFDMSHLKSGTYFLKIQFQNNQTEWSKIVLR